MQRKLLKYRARRIASPLLGLAVWSCLPLTAETAGPRLSGPRLSSPILGWVLSAGGAQVTEIAGVTGSPRTGSSIPLPVAAQRLWPSPDARAALLQAGTGLYLLRAGAGLEQVADLPPGTAVAAAWDRGSAAVAACWGTTCRAFGDGAAQWEVPAESAVLAYSVSQGLATVSGEQMRWQNGDRVIQGSGRPLAGAFRPGTGELWTADAAGSLTVWNAEGSQVLDLETVPGPIALAMAADGSALFLVNAEGAAATVPADARRVDHIEVGETVEGAWPVPGTFAVRLHDSAKRAIGFWDGETGQLTWAPVAAVAEVSQ